MKIELLLICFGIGLPATRSKVISQPDTSSFAFYPSSTENEVNNRIIGGYTASPHQFPYQVGMYVKEQSQTTFCGGSLISQNYVLTAAHCVVNALEIEVILGAQNISQTEPSQIRFENVTTFTYHSEWGTSLYLNDIAVIRLPETVSLNENVQTIPLATGSSSFAGDTGVVSGWGKTSDAVQTVASSLMYTNVSILTNEACAAIDPFNTVVQSQMMCTSGEGIKGTCSGDSGGPLVDNGVQVGLVSFGYKTCEAGKPTVYTRLTEYQQWIKDNSDVDY